VIGVTLRCKITDYGDVWDVIPKLGLQRAVAMKRIFLDPPYYCKRIRIRRL